MNLWYERIATGRDGSLLASDIETHRVELTDRIANSRIAVVGAAGSIGSSVVRTLLHFSPRSLVLIDISENNLVELVRDLRSSVDVQLPPDFATLPIAMGSVEFARYFAESPPSTTSSTSLPSSTCARRRTSTVSSA